jgi:proline iminopeptidase
LDNNAAFDEGQVAMTHGHSIRTAQYGNPDGLPLFWLHGGPGSGASPRHAGLVDPARYRLVLADQRGCGGSRPAGALEHNDTSLLVDDIERLRRHLGLPRILLGGGSWGATLALAYAARHPGRLCGLLLRSPFLATAAEVDGFFDGDDCRREFAALAPASARHALLPWLAGALASDDEALRAAVAQAWWRHEQRRAGARSQAPPPPGQALVQRYRIQSHYLRHGCFVDSAALLQAAAGLRGLPVAILHGAEDRVCPSANAHRIRQSVAGSRLRLAEGAGHDPFHPAMAAALEEALARFAAQRSFEGWGEGDD